MQDARRSVVHLAQFLGVKTVHIDRAAKVKKVSEKGLTNRDESGIILGLPKKAARKDRMKRMKKTLKKAKKLLKKVLTNGKECGIIYKLSRQTGCS